MGNTKSRYSPQELLDYYIERKDTPNIEEILQKNPEVIDKPINKHTKQTALMRACFNGNLELAKIFKAAGANVNAVNKKGDTALATAVKRNHIQMVQYLIQGGADVRFATDSGIKIIDYAILSGFYDIAKLVYTHLSQRDRELKPVEQYEALAKKYAYRYVNYEVVMRGLQQGLTLNEIPNFLKKQKPKLVDPVVDPRQTWTDWAKRTIQFKDAPLVQRQNLPQHLQPQNRLIGKLHHYTHNFMSTKGSRKPSLHPIRNQTGSEMQDLQLNHIEKAEVQSN